MLTECIIFTMKMKKPQKTTTMKVIKTTEGKLRLISYKEANYIKLAEMVEDPYINVTTITGQRVSVTINNN